MTDPIPPVAPAAPAAPPPAAGRGLKIALAVSVALNLAVAGLVAGAWISDHGPRSSMPRDLSFGPFSEALSPDDRRALRKAFMEKGSDFRSTHEAARAEFETLLTVLRTKPLDAPALTAALEAVEQRSADRLDLGRGLIEARLVQMTDAERLAFADRLEHGLREMRP